MSLIKPLSDLSPYEYEHPFDEKALNLLKGTPGLEPICRKLTTEGIEKFYMIQCRGSNLKITEENYPEIFTNLVTVCRTLNHKVIPDLYVEWDDNINASTVGIDQPLIIVTSGTIDRLSPLEIKFILGHEIGHIKSCHALYHLMANSVATLGDLLGGISSLFTLPLKLALQKWSRMSEFTADRCGLLACQDFNSTTSVFIKMAGLPESLHDRINLHSFLSQAREFDSLDFEGLSKWIKFAANMMHSTHPWTVLRIRELIRWMESGEYQRVLERKTSNRLYIRYEGNLQFCRKCGYRLQGQEKFCNSCGQMLQISCT